MKFDLSDISINKSVSFCEFLTVFFVLYVTFRQKMGRGRNRQQRRKKKPLTRAAFDAKSAYLEQKKEGKCPQENMEEEKKMPLRKKLGTPTRP